jgi:hypothetical protein
MKYIKRGHNTMHHSRDHQDCSRRDSARTHFQSSVAVQRLYTKGNWSSSQKKELPSLNIGGEGAANTVVLNPLLLEYITKQKQQQQKEMLNHPLKR